MSKQMEIIQAFECEIGDQRQGGDSQSDRLSQSILFELRGKRFCFGHQWGSRLDDCRAAVAIGF